MTQQADELIIGLLGSGWSFIYFLFAFARASSTESSTISDATPDPQLYTPISSPSGPFLIWKTYVLFLWITVCGKFVATDTTSYPWLIVKQHNYTSYPQYTL